MTFAFVEDTDILKQAAVGHALPMHNNSTVVKKRKLTARKVQNIFSLLRGVKSFWHHCNMVGVLTIIGKI